MYIFLFTHRNFNNEKKSKLQITTDVFVYNYLINFITFKSMEIGNGKEKK